MSANDEYIFCHNQPPPFVSSFIFMIDSVKLHRTSRKESARSA
jgi:hypothetical protein